MRIPKALYCRLPNPATSPSHPRQSGRTPTLSPRPSSPSRASRHRAGSLRSAAPLPPSPPAASPDPLGWPRSDRPRRPCRYAVRLHARRHIIDLALGIRRRHARLAPRPCPLPASRFRWPAVPAAGPAGPTPASRSRYRRPPTPWPRKPPSPPPTVFPAQPALCFASQSALALHGIA